jgi:ABC-type nitrate/sulfonate/bicarbonate transport system substrate-binding protein
MLKGPRVSGAVWFVSLIVLPVPYGNADAQSNLKKVRIGVSETHVGYLPLQVAYHKGFYKDEGIDLEIVLMATNVVNTAALTEAGVAHALTLIDEGHRFTPEFGALCLPPPLAERSRFPGCRFQQAVWPPSRVVSLFLMRG